MALKDWKKRKARNPYIEKSYYNPKKGWLLEIHYDIGFGKQRNVTVYNYKKQLYSGFEKIKTIYCKSLPEAKKKAEIFMTRY